eukprot:1850636-Rhodomonas_salina.1
MRRPRKRILSHTCPPSPYYAQYHSQPTVQSSAPGPNSPQGEVLTLGIVGSPRANPRTTLKYYTVLGTLARTKVVVPHRSSTNPARNPYTEAGSGTGLGHSTSRVAAGPPSYYTQYYTLCPVLNPARSPYKEAGRGTKLG